MRILLNLARIIPVMTFHRVILRFTSGWCPVNRPPLPRVRLRVPLFGMPRGVCGLRRGGTGEWGRAAVGEEHLV